MVTVALYVRIEAKPGKEADVEKFLRGGLAIVNEEPATTAWFAIRTAVGMSAPAPISAAIVAITVSPAPETSYTSRACAGN